MIEVIQSRIIIGAGKEVDVKAIERKPTSVDFTYLANGKYDMWLTLEKDGCTKTNYEIQIIKMSGGAPYAGESGKSETLCAGALRQIDLIDVIQPIEIGTWPLREDATFIISDPTSISIQSIVDSGVK